MSEIILKDKPVDIGTRKSVGGGVSKVGGKESREKRLDSFIEHEFLYFKILHFQSFYL